MNPSSTGSDPSAVQQALSHQGSLLGQHERLIQVLVESNLSMTESITNLTAQISTLTSSAILPVTSNPPPVSTPCRDFHITDPEPFHGEVEKCKGFIFQCNKVFRQRFLSFPSDVTKINYVLNLLRGRALDWAEALSSSVDYDTLSFGVFSEQLSIVFDHPDYSGSAENRLLTLQQGNRSVADYSIEFRTLAAEARWDEAALRAVFVKGLKDQLKDELAARDVPADLQALITLVSRLDSRLRERRAEKAQRSPFAFPSKPSYSPRFAPSVSTPSGFTSSPRGPPLAREEPMQLGRTGLSPEERLRRMRLGECLYCGKFGHLVAGCPVRPNAEARQ